MNLASAAGARKLCHECSELHFVFFCFFPDESSIQKLVEPLQL